MGINAEQHTPGRVEANQIKHTLLAVDRLGSDTVAENSRRLAACWNACEGISTDELEAVATNADAVFRLRMLAHYATFRALTNDAREHLADDVAQPHESAASPGYVHSDKSTFD
jgi:hypothetical protein